MKQELENLQVLNKLFEEAVRKFEANLNALNVQPNNEIRKQAVKENYKLLNELESNIMGQLQYVDDSLSRMQGHTSPGKLYKNQHQYQQSTNDYLYLRDKLTNFVESAESKHIEIPFTKFEIDTDKKTNSKLIESIGIQALNVGAGFNITPEARQLWIAIVQKTVGSHSTKNFVAVAQTQNMAARQIIINEEKFRSDIAGILEKSPSIVEKLEKLTAINKEFIANNTSAYPESYCKELFNSIIDNSKSEITSDQLRQKLKDLLVESMLDYSKNTTLTDFIQKASEIFYAGDNRILQQTLKEVKSELQQEYHNSLINKETNHPAHIFNEQFQTKITDIINIRSETNDKIQEIVKIMGKIPIELLSAESRAQLLKANRALMIEKLTEPGDIADKISQLLKRYESLPKEQFGDEMQDLINQSVVRTSLDYIKSFATNTLKVEENGGYKTDLIERLIKLDDEIKKFNSALPNGVFSQQANLIYGMLEYQSEINYQQLKNNDENNNIAEVKKYIEKVISAENASLANIVNQLRALQKINLSGNMRQYLNQSQEIPIEDWVKQVMTQMRREYEESVINNNQNNPIYKFDLNLRQKIEKIMTRVGSSGDKITDLVQILKQAPPEFLPETTKELLQNNIKVLVASRLREPGHLSEKISELADRFRDISEANRGDEIRNIAMFMLTEASQSYKEDMISKLNNLNITDRINLLDIEMREFNNALPDGVPFQLLDFVTAQREEAYKQILNNLNKANDFGNKIEALLQMNGIIKRNNTPQEITEAYDNLLNSIEKRDIEKAFKQIANSKDISLIQKISNWLKVVEALGDRHEIGNIKVNFLTKENILQELSRIKQDHPLFEQMSEVDKLLTILPDKLKSNKDVMAEIDKIKEQQNKELSDQLITSSRNKFQSFSIEAFLGEKESSKILRDHQNNIINFARSYILDESNMQARVMRIERMIDIAGRCLAQEDFLTSRGILTALTSRPVSNLSQSLDLLSPEAMKKFQDVLTKMDNAGDYENYRNHLKNSQGIIVPDIGIHAGDVTKTLENGKNWATNGGLGIVGQTLISMQKRLHNVQPLSHKNDLEHVLTNQAKQEDLLEAKAKKYEPSDSEDYQNAKSRWDQTMVSHEKKVAKERENLFRERQKNVHSDNEVNKDNKPAVNFSDKINELASFLQNKKLPVNIETLPEFKNVESTLLRKLSNELSSTDTLLTKMHDVLNQNDTRQNFNETDVRVTNITNLLYLIEQNYIRAMSHLQQDNPEHQQLKQILIAEMNKYSALNGFVNELSKTVQNQNSSSQPEIRLEVIQQRGSRTFSDAHPSLSIQQNTNVVINNTNNHQQPKLRFAQHLEKQNSVGKQKESKAGDIEPINPRQSSYMKH